MARRKDNKLDQLSNVRLFSACTRKELELIGKASDEITVPSGKVLVEQGKPGFEFYLILDGEAVVKRNNKKIAALGPGGSFGELALLTRLPRNATVQAATDMELLVLGQREFSGLLDEVPGMAHKLLASMAERLSQADAKSTSN
ncbi:MAG: family transcriptional regulator, cyclic receptor protein [Actinomycetota bacterium]|jgi:CRP-like cAMP-binding protein|nr:family transcriptional regulator, cyclic receptor protein [Actinomycetota bacterium]